MYAYEPAHDLSISCKMFEPNTVDSRGDVVGTAWANNETVG